MNPSYNSNWKQNWQRFNHLKNNTQRWQEKDDLFPWEHIPIPMIQECLEFKQKAKVLFTRGIKWQSLGVTTVSVNWKVEILEKKRAKEETYTLK